VIGIAAVAAAGVGVFLWARGHRDPRQWPAELAAEWAQVRADVTEALEVAGRAAKRREAEIDEELRDAGRPR
jgi:hypothetical protein